jgi:hypothetical protein
MDAGGNKRPTGGGIVAIIVKGMGNRFRDHHGACKMNHGFKCVRPEKLREKHFVTDIPLDKFYICRKIFFDPGTEIIQDDHMLTAVKKPVHHVTANVTRAPCDQDGHNVPLIFSD